MESGLTAGMIGRVGKAYDLVIAMHDRSEKSGELLRRERAVWAGSPELTVRNLAPCRLHFIQADVCFGIGRFLRSIAPKGGGGLPSSATASRLSRPLWRKD
jgi:hypothetical protein